MYFSNSIGIVYDNAGVYDSALVYFYESLDIAKQLNKEKDIAIALTNIGNINFDLGLNESAINFYKQAIEIKERIGSAGLETTYYNIGLCYASLEDHEKALESFQKLIDLCTNGKCDKNSLDRGLIGIGISYYVLRDYDNCEQYMLQVIDSEDKKVRTSAYRYLSMVNNMRGNYKTALEYVKKSIEISQSTNNMESLKHNYQLLGDIYKSTNKLDSAMIFYDRHFDLKDSLFNETVAGGIRDLFVGLERKQAQIEIDAKQKQLETRKKIVILLALVLILTAILIWFIISDLLKRRTRNIYLDEQVNLKTAQLQLSNTELREKKNDLDNLVYKISHDIRGPLARLQGLIQIGKLENTTSVYDKLERESSSLEKILNRMAVVNSINHHKLENIEIKLEDFINQLLEKYKNQWHDYVMFKVEVGDTVIMSDPELLDITLFNLLDNAVVFRDKSKLSIVRVGYENNTLFVEDNGQGFDAKYANQLTNLFFVANEKAGTGIGLHHTHLALSKLGAKLKVASAFEPTRFEIKFS
jgi:signal transduction histidine kinase